MVCSSKNDLIVAISQISLNEIIITLICLVQRVIRCEFKV